MAKKKEPTVEMEMEMLDIDSIEPNPYNPNVHNAKTFEWLKKNMGKYGYIEPVVVAPSGNGKFVTLDGEHRFLALKEMGEKKIRAVVVKGLPEHAVFVAPLAFNKCRGELSTEKICKMLAAGVDRFTEKDIREWCLLPGHIMEEYLEFWKMKREEIEEVARQPSVTTEPKELRGQPTESVPRMLILHLPPKDFEMVNNTLKRYGDSPEKGLVALCRSVSNGGKTKTKAKKG